MPLTVSIRNQVLGDFTQIEIAQVRDFFSHPWSQAVLQTFP